MGKIRVRVSQAGGTDDDNAAMVGGNVTVNLSPETTGVSISSDSSAACTLLVGVRQTPLTQISTGPDGNGGLNLLFSSGTSVDSYSITSLQNVPGFTVSDLDPASGAVIHNRVSEEVMARMPAPSGGSVSFFQRIWLFFARLFGLKAG